ncbi:MAG: D-alanyl-D-alanine carboxypeptidase [Syntrophomonas sp.]|uniref:D-alanyl-D-alanine carboxypeptidase family protein n=1 Tax=Syntrophomonas sp. TaxID=2053627 RepID=UPI002628DF40|nr:D-alanyl-D-alanine carboxypeptidase family protein [Syntrophomonas sp.]MDD2511233.1 D-alanyl-D-alanine carboxypeptidase [Syntrophomonas sp.]MDD3879805.1 D-alanyl-D-alanine carboxypeptidase [Syntrophomonas sp.]MDD4626911.1 D-alanyl-D-alanine carboxypeptidase [Syntrophomonas sp.]
MCFRRSIAWLVLWVLVFIIAAPSRLEAEVVEARAESYILMDADSGKVLLAKNEHKQLAPASMTKLMTLILAVESLEEGKATLKDKVVTSENAWKMGGSQIYLEPGEPMSYEDMLIAIAVGSANDACVAVAEHLEGTHQNFVDKMNNKAKMLGLKNTHFINSYGLTAPKHYTSAYDMAVIGRQALAHPRILEYSSIKEYDLRQGEFKLFNTNKLLWWYQGADGFKTGWTDEAKYCLVGTAKRDGLRLISVVMASPEKHGNFRDSMQLLNYGFARYSFKSLIGQGKSCGTVKIGKGIEEQVEVIAEEEVGCTVIKGEEKKISRKTSLLSYVDAPVSKGQKLGEISLYKNGDLLKEINLVAASDVGRGGLLKEIGKIFAEIYLL